MASQKTSRKGGDLMSKRVTIVLADDLDKKIRTKQAHEIKKTSSHVSFSGTINQILRKCLS